MLAVTQEDFVHPMAVIDFLWRACCASDAERDEQNMTIRLKVRQRTQMLVGHALLLFIFLFDVLRQYLALPPQIRLHPELCLVLHRTLPELANFLLGHCLSRDLHVS